MECTPIERGIREMKKFLIVLLFILVIMFCEAETISAKSPSSDKDGIKKFVIELYCNEHECSNGIDLEMNLKTEKSLILILLESDIW